MYKYTFPRIVISYYKKKTRLGTPWWKGEYDFIKNYFKIKNYSILCRVWREFSISQKFTYYSKKQRKQIPFAGILLPVKLFKEINLTEHIAHNKNRALSSKEKYNATETKV